MVRKRLGTPGLIRRFAQFITSFYPLEVFFFWLIRHLQFGF